MTLALPPPPWEHLTRLLRLSLFAYVSLFFLAFYVAWARSGRRYSPVAVSPSEISIFRRFLNCLLHYAYYATVTRMVLSTIICIAYVCFTYIGSISAYALFTMKAFGIYMVLYILFMIATTDRPISFIFHPLFIFEVLSITSLLFAKKNDWLNFSFLQAYVFMNSYFSLEPVLEVNFMLKSSQFQRQLARRAVEFLAFIYVFACGLQLFERMGEPWSTFVATTFELTLANSFYFTVVTIFTVGYGDFVPFTLLGRFWIIFIIVFGAYLVARKIGQVIDVFKDFRRGRGSFVKPEDTDHCVICGNVKWEYLKSFVQEFYEDDRNVDKKLVVMCEQPNWTEDTWNKFIAIHPVFSQHVVYLEGACVSREDLVRAQVDSALSVFILCNQHNPDPYAEDSETLKRILTIRSYSPKIPIYSMCALRESMIQINLALEHLDEQSTIEDGASRHPSMANVNLINQTRRSDDVLAPAGINDDHYGNAAIKDYSEDDDDDGLLVESYDGSSDLKSEAICMQEVEMSLMAENVFCNGLSTLLANLILRIDPISKLSDSPWAIEYKIGSECRFEFVRLPMELHNRKFSEIAVIMYDYGVLLIATKRFMDRDWKPINPDTTIKVNTVGLIITYHSFNYLDNIMKAIAMRITMLFDESISERSSHNVPSLDDDFNGQAEPSRHSLAGSFLAGDIPITMEDSAEEHYELPQDYALTRSRSIANPSPPMQAMSRNDADDAIEPDLVLSCSAPPESVLSTATTIPPIPEQTLPIPSPDIGEEPVGLSTIHRAELTTDDENQRGPEVPPPTPAIDMLTQNVVDFGIPTVGTAGPSHMAEMPISSQATYVEGSSSLHKDFSAQNVEESDPQTRIVTPSRSKGQHKSVNFTEMTRSRSSSSKRTARNTMDGRGSKSEKRTYPLIYYGDEPLPTKMKNHVVVCAIGEMSMLNLKFFLQRIWARRGPSDRNGSRNRKTPVVAICPSISEDDEAELSTFSSEELFLVEGNSLSVRTLKSAQYEQAKAIVILACEDKTRVEDLDAKAIFTVMTLDQLLGERSDTFVCTMLDAEESMQLLRAPKHARRKGSNLGRTGDSYFHYPLRSAFQSEDSRLHAGAYLNAGENLSRSRNELSQGSRRQRDAFASRTLSFGALSVSSALPQSMSFVGVWNSRYTDRRETITNLTAQESDIYRSDRKPEPRWSFLDDVGLRNYPSIGGMSSLHFLNASTMSMGGGGIVPEDSALGRYRDSLNPMKKRNREESFEKSRYASGEMMISSTFMSLLIREYAMPGLTGIVRKIFGAGFGKNARSRRCWIRTIAIPRKWIQLSRSGQRIYRDVFECLLKHGAVALGLYRAGDVKVRLQYSAHPDQSGADLDGGNMTGVSHVSSGNHHSEESLERDFFSSPDVTDAEGTFEIGGESRVDAASRSYEHGGLLQDVAGYGTIHGREQVGSPQTSASVENEGVTGTRVDRVQFPPELFVDMAADMNLVRNGGGEDEIGDAENLDEGELGHYTCPTTGRESMFKEHNAGNQLPYVYANPEPYTLVSEHDAVYVLVSPQTMLPDEW